ncbi:translational GTPase TypA [Candidatus Beckwithbacteria bacterium]|nr:translational GTPase TypA [Candidatus Beckwithbacteria bacterium]
MDQNKLRNIAIIAHVDHGKTTLVDNVLKQAHVFESYQAEMQQTTILDSNDLERERGVTILAKNTAVMWQDYKINILDTPGHADFSGEVERVLNMADGCLLLVDSAEGVLSQTRYVLSLALKLGLTPIVIINKIDRKDQRIKEVLEEINNLFLELASDPAQLEFPVLYAIGKDGVAGFSYEIQGEGSATITDSQNLFPLFKVITEVIPAPQGDNHGPFQMQVTNLDYDGYKGRYIIGRIARGSIKTNQALAIMRNEQKIGQARVEYLFNYYGLSRQEIEEAEVGEIVALTGFSQVKIGDTICDVEHLEALPSLEITEPTMQIQISVSTSPFVGQDGEFTTSRQIKQRLEKELESNVSLRLKPGPTGESFIVSGRGELHLAILIETMRREGFEFSVGRPEVIYRQKDGSKTEPYELVTIDVPESHAGVVIAAMGQRRGEMVNMQQTSTGTRFDYKISTNNLIGFRSQLLTETSGLGVINSLYLGYEAVGEALINPRNGVFVAIEQGKATAYSIANAQERGTTFVAPGTDVYAGMIVGLSSKKDDMGINIIKGKKLTNMRSSTADIAVHIAPPVYMSLEQCLTFLAADELLEVTPKHLRLRKKELNAKHVR